jgi:prevent-host-death family protein
MQITKTTLRRNLSSALSRVRAGEVLLVTDHGRPLVRIVPVSDGKTATAHPAAWSDIEQERIRDLVQRGALIWLGGKPQGGPGHTVISGGTMADMAGEDRR